MRHELGRDRDRRVDALPDLSIDGPYPSIWMLDDLPGIWIVIGADETGGKRVVDLGWARSVRSGIYDHPAVLRWRAGARASGYAACYTEDEQLIDHIGARLPDPARRSAGTVG
jgi:hypothetical protein